MTPKYVEERPTMSTTEDAAEVETGVEQITEDTLIPIRIGSGHRGGLCIGNEEQSLTANSSYTRYLVYATAESVLRCESVNSTDRGVLSTLMDSGLEFETYTEEADNRFGRPALQIIVDEGAEAYAELRDQIDDNAYLHAAINETTVWDAAQELDVTPVLPIIDGDGEIVNTIGGGWGDPDLVSGAIEHEGDVLEADLREITPSLEFVVENWSTLSGSRSGIVNRLRGDDTDRDQLLAMARDDPDAQTAQFIVNSSDDDITAHGVREIEEAVVADEEDRYKSFCGMVKKRKSKATVLELEMDSVADRLLCSLCAKSMD